MILLILISAIFLGLYWASPLFQRLVKAIWREARGALERKIEQSEKAKGPTPEERAIAQHLAKPRPQSKICGCVGPKDGDPLCPCSMAWVEKVDGHWYKVAEIRTHEGVTHTASRLS